MVHRCLKLKMLVQIESQVQGVSLEFCGLCLHLGLETDGCTDEQDSNSVIYNKRVKSPEKHRDKPVVDVARDAQCCVHMRP